MGIPRFQVLAGIAAILLIASYFLIRSERPAPLRIFKPAGADASRKESGVVGEEQRSRLISPVNARQLVYGHEWDGPLPSKSAEFRRWVTRYLETADAERRKGLEAEGVSLAKARGEEMRLMIEHDPERALATTVPLALRERLPQVIAVELERRVRGTGDVVLMCSTPNHALMRSVVLSGRSYAAHVYGRRVKQLSKERVSLHGIVVDGQLALHESPLRLLEPGELADNSAEITNPFTFEAAAATSAQLLVEVHGRIWLAATEGDLTTLHQRLVAAESGLASQVPPILLTKPATAEPVLSNADTAWTTGHKRVLVIRVDYADFPEEWMNYTAAQEMMDNVVKRSLEANSYGRLTLTSTVTPKTYRMPRTAAAYVALEYTLAFVQQFADASDAAKADHTVDDYDFVIVASPDITNKNLPNSPFTTGNAWMGSRRSWVNGHATIAANDTTTPSTIIHELGHNMGLEHANLWQVTDGNPISPNGRTSEYGDRFDAMAGPRDPVPAHFNARWKNRLGWLPSSAITDVAQTGTYRIYRFDSAAAPLDRPQVLRIFRDGLRYYWVGHRQNYSRIANGAYIIWGFDDRLKSQLLDLTTPGEDAFDAALPIGGTLADPDYGVTISPIARGGAEPAQYLDVLVTVRSPPNSVIAWGDTATGFPTNVAHVRAIAAGERHTLVLRFDGTIAAWGDNTYGQTNVPSDLTDVAAIAAGGNVSAAIKLDGSLVLWGDKSGGLTTPPAGLSMVRHVAVGYDHVIAVKHDATLVAWGNNAAGQLNVPSFVPHSPLKQLAAGYRTSFALNGNETNGNLVVWGARLSNTPSSASGIHMMAAGYAHALYVRYDGTVVAWGDNSLGQCNVPSGLRDVVAVAAGRTHSLALRADGRVIAWGDDGSGQVRVPEYMPRTFSLAAGGRQSLALTAPSIVITAQPKSQTAQAGGAASFSVVATSTAPLAYQWRRDGQIIPGATSATLSLPGAASSHAGQYDVIISDGSRSVTSASAGLTVLTEVSRIANMSIRSAAGSGASTLIVGFSVGGASGTKPLLVRGAGPALASFGVTEALSDPRMEIFVSGSNVPFIANDDWSDTQVRTLAAQVGAFALSAGSKDSGLLAPTEAPGSYSVQITGAGGATGVALAEIYDVSSVGTVFTADTPRLTNVSARTFCGTGGDILIAGFAIAGPFEKRVLVRAVGPALRQFGVTGELADPRIEVFDGNVRILQNDDWGGDAVVRSAFAAVGAFDLAAGSKDAAAILRLAPGAYTAQVSGVNGATGIALVEIYELP